MSESRNGGFIQTYSRAKFWPKDPCPDEVEIADIAHALSNICRFGGHTREFYSVAQHSVFVSNLLDSVANQRRGLMHDATEAYIGDIVRPIKQDWPEYQAVEARLWHAVCERFGLREEHLPGDKWADNTALVTEARDLFDIPPEWIKNYAERPLEFRVTPWPPQDAERLFLARWEELQ